MTDDVVALLEDLRLHLEPPRADFEPVGRAMATIRTTVLAAPRQRRRRARRVAAGLAAIGAVFLLPPARAAVADLLGLGGVRIELTGSLPAHLGRDLELGAPVAIEDARRQAPAPLPLPDTLGDPAQAFAGVPPGAVTIAWAPDDELPEVGDSGVGLLISMWPASLNDDLALKTAGPGTTVESVDVNGSAGYFISGALHAFQYLDAHGNPQPDRARLAANTLLWSRAGVTYRLESTLDLDSSVSLATSIPT